MKNIFLWGSAAAAALCVSVAVAAPPADPAGSPLFGVQLPREYRDWKLVGVAQENGMNNDIRAILANDVALKAFRDNVRPFPDGSIIVRLAWRYEPSPRNDLVFPAPQSFVAGAPTNIQVSVKDSEKYAATGGWGYGQFENGIPNPDRAVVEACYACHKKLAKLEPAADYVFTHYSP